MPVRAWFPTLVYDAPLLPKRASAEDRRLNGRLLAEALRLAEIDGEGLRWSRERYPNGYTSYASMPSLHRMSPWFADLERHLDRHVRSFSRSLDLDVPAGDLGMTDCWVNVMSKGCAHTLHLHPTSVISGTYYVRVPRGGAPIRFEDPRHAHRMATPPRRVDARPRNQSMVAHEASSGTVVLFESWLRHEVPASRVATRRVSISFNYS